MGLIVAAAHHRPSQQAYACFWFKFKRLVHGTEGMTTLSFTTRINNCFSALRVGYANCLYINLN